MKRILTISTVLFIFFLSACQPKSPEAAATIVPVTTENLQEPTAVMLDESKPETTP